MFYNLSLASRRVEDRRVSREQLRGHLRKIKLVASESPKKSVISAELAKVEQNLSNLITNKAQYSARPTLEEKKHAKRLKEKEEELDKKIQRMNELLSKLGKKVKEEDFRKQLDEETKEKPDLKDELENRLYELESRYYDMVNNSKYPQEVLDSIKEKISNLKERIRASR